MKNKIIILMVGLVLFFTGRDNNTDNKNNNTTTTTTVTSKKENITENEAIEILKATDYEKLGLPVSASEYEIIIFDDVKIDNVDCYEKVAFANLENRKYNVGTFAVSKNGENVYKIVDGEYQKNRKKLIGSREYI